MSRKFLSKQLVKNVKRSFCSQKRLEDWDHVIGREIDFRVKLTAENDVYDTKKLQSEIKNLRDVHKHVNSAVGNLKRLKAGQTSILVEEAEDDKYIAKINGAMFGTAVGFWIFYLTSCPYWMLLGVPCSLLASAKVVVPYGFPTDIRNSVDSAKTILEKCKVPSVDREWMMNYLDEIEKERKIWSDVNKLD
jgi:hypothetical protein